MVKHKCPALFEPKLLLSSLEKGSETTRPQLDVFQGQITSNRDLKLKNERKHQHSLKNHLKLQLSLNTIFFPTLSIVSFFHILNQVLLIWLSNNNLFFNSTRDDISLQYSQTILPTVSFFPKLNSPLYLFSSFLKSQHSPILIMGFLLHTKFHFITNNYSGSQRKEKRESNARVLK